MSKKLAAFTICLLLVLLCSEVLQACPTCKAGLAEGDPQRAGMVRGYFYSIIFMMSMPFLILSALGSYFYLLIHRARAERGAMASLEPSPLRRQ